MTTTTLTAPARRFPWDVMGSSLSPDTTVPEALAEAGMDYTVTMQAAFGVRAIYSGTRVDRLIPAPDYRAAVRRMPDGTDKVLGIVGKRYRPIDNASAFATGDVLVREYGAKIIGATDYRTGGASLLVLDLAQPVVLRRADGLTDRVDLDLLIKNSHNGQSALTFALTGVRVACTNAVQAAVKGAERTWRISHTPNAAARIALAQKAIINAVTWRDGFEAVAQSMLDQKMVDAEFAKIVADMFPVAPDATGAVADRRRAVQRHIITMHRKSSTLDGIRGTRWGGYNAVTEYMDHFRPATSDVMRAEGTLDGPAVRAKALAWATFSRS